MTKSQRPNSKTATAANERYSSFAAFWPYYLSEHRLKKNRALHYLGTVLATGVFLVSVITGWWWGLLMVFLLGYGPAWIGHFFIERNRPATLQYPMWSFLADYKMLSHAVRGDLGQQLSEHLRTDAKLDR